MHSTITPSYGETEKERKKREGEKEGGKRKTTREGEGKSGRVTFLMDLH